MLKKQTISHYKHQLKQKVKERSTKSMLYVFVYFPTVLIFLYLFFIHSPMYISESNFAVRSNDMNADAGGLGGLLALSAAPTSTVADAHIVQAYILSMDMLNHIQAQVDFVGHYSSRSRDIISRLSRNHTQEELLEFWHWAVSATYDMDKGFITVYVKAYTPEMAQTINKLILQNSEALVNQMNNRAHQDSIRLTKEEVTLAEERLAKARIALQGFRDGKELLDPQETAKKLEEVVASLEVAFASTQAELAATIQVKSKKNIHVVMLENKLKALKEQIAKEKSRLAGVNDNNETLSSVIGNYSQLVIEEQFAQEQLVKAMSTLESARIKAISQSRYIIPFQLPTLPDESLYPRPLLFSFFGFIGLLMSLGIISLVVAAIKDHVES
ncbi:hypothetical protein [Desulfovibrio litoralis]|uniref:Capsular polysaccharide transport system permease protein n=1 Tax=Desulfovibrio litoralis DSM 11393 TaxID=1121455 RepID=A0A1M7TN33_9BACT|nr:hypothetical protein [Desulfovibrio litoralis]SHN72043.1 capsular polysaccharide transport system permease protein [Desulfovibrio litoralis DSM 11393]